MGRLALEEGISPERIAASKKRKHDGAERPVKKLKKSSNPDTDTPTPAPSTNHTRNKKQFIHHSRRSQIPGAGTEKSNSHTTKSRRTNPSTRISSLRKLLARDILPPAQKRDKELELNSLLYDQETALVARNRKQMIEKYHMVRFFERRKAERRLKRLVKEDGRENGREDDGNIREEIKEVQVDVNYTIYAPLGEKYIGLYGGTDEEEHEDKSEEENGKVEKKEKKKKSSHGTTVKGKPPIWHEVKKCMQDDNPVIIKRALLSLRDRIPASIDGRAITHMRQRSQHEPSNGNRTVESRKPKKSNAQDPESSEEHSSKEDSEEDFFQR